jgi:diguanylate cyclase (GGDEF)-like protein/PAS domain S-box-containing protein
MPDVASHRRVRVEPEVSGISYQFSRFRRWVGRRFALQLSAIPLVIVVCTILIMLDGYHSWGLRTQDLAEAGKETANLAESLGQQAEDTMRTADMSIIGSVQRLEIDGTGSNTLEKLRQIMVARLAAFPALASFVIADAAGKCLMIDLPAVPADCSLAGTAGYEFHRTHEDRGPHLSAPERAIGSDTWVIPLSRRFNGPDGSFAGIVVTGISIPYFTHYYDTFNIGQHGSIALALTDGHLLVRRPYVDLDVPRTLLSGTVFRSSLAPGSMGVSRIKSSIDGVMRLTSYRRMEDYPLFIAAGESMDDILASWRATLWSRLALIAGLVALVGILGARLTGQIRKHERIERAYRLLAENSADVIMWIGPDSKRIYVSPSVRDLTGYEPDELIRGSHGELVHPNDRAEWKASVARSLKSGKTQTIYRMTRKDGSSVWVEATRRRLPDGGFVSTTRDVSARKQAEDQLAEANRRLEVLARQDGLTGLANRRQFDETLEAEFRRAIRDKTPLSLIMIDVDRFKAFNDSYGHPAGDHCLTRIALVLGDTANRPADLAVRYGGEEFALLLPNTSRAGALAIAERARCSVRSLEIEHRDTPEKIVTISLGVAWLVPGHGQNEARDLVKAADVALYDSKARGRDMVSSVTAPAEATVVR